MPCSCRATNHRCPRCAAAHREVCRQQYQRRRAGLSAPVRVKPGPKPVPGPLPSEVYKDWQERFPRVAAWTLRMFRNIGFCREDAMQECRIACFLNRTDKEAAKEARNRVRRMLIELTGSRGGDRPSREISYEEGNLCRSL